MECPPFVRIRYRTGRELLYDLRSWGARRRWRKGKRPHFASLVGKDRDDRDPGWPHNRVARFAAMAGLMGPRRR